MAKQLALQLKITSEGTEKVISNINELETELKVLQDRLKTLDFGSAAFQEATANISKLRTKIDEIDKASEGIGAEKRFRAIGDAVNVLTGSFQVLSGVLSLVITDEENLAEVQAAEKAALDVLNIALGVNAINTALVESATLRKAAADKLATIATQAAALAQRAFNAVLAANPIALVITAIGALTAAYFAFSEETKKVNKGLDEQKIKSQTLEDITQKSIKTRDEEIKKIQSLVAISELDNLSRADRVKILKEIQSQYPNYLKNQDLEKVSLQQIKEANDKLVEAITKVARARAAADKLAEIQTKKLEIETARQSAVESQRQQEQEAYNLLDASQTNKRIEVLRNLGKVRDDQAAKSVKELDFQEKIVLNYIKENDLIDELADGFTKAENASKSFNDSQTKVIETTINALDKLLGRLNKLQEIELTYSSEIIKAQEEVISKQEASLTNQTNILTSQAKKLQTELFKLLRETIPDESDAALLEDGYIELFDTISKLYTTGQIDLQKSLGFDDFVKEAERVIPGIGDRLRAVGEDGKESFVEFFNEIKFRVKDIQEIQKSLKIDVFGDLETTKKLGEIEDKIYTLRKDRVKLGLSERDINEKSLMLINDAFGLTEKQQELEAKISAQREIVKKATEKTKGLEDNKLKALETQLIKQKEISTTLLEQINRSGEFYLIAEKINEQANKNAEQIRKNLEERRRKYTEGELEGLKEYFASNANQFQVLFTDIAVNINDYIAKVGVEGVKQLISEVETNFANIDNLSREQLEKLKAYLMVVGNELASSLGVDGELFIKIIEKITKRLEELPSKAEENFTKVITDIKKIADIVLQVFNDISSRLSGIIQSQNSLLLEQLEYQKEQSLAVLDEAAGQSAEQDARIAEERAKIEKEYAKKRFEAEKKARVQELQFTLANTLAQAAQAVVNALATIPAPFGAIYSGVIAGLTAAQIAVINDQIQFAQNKVFIGRRGGLINGASHDDMSGGVPAMLEGGEFVMNKEAVKQFGDVIGSINNSTGGRALTIDDSRLVQAIASQNSSKTPIKTYVLYNDIKDTNKLNNKIEQLARL